MTDASRRDLLSGMIGAVGVASAAATAALPRTVSGMGAKPEPADALITAVARLLADLDSAICTPGVANADLRRVFDDGAILAGTVGPGDFIVARDPVRAIAMMPVRHRGADIRLPVAVAFAGNGAGLRIASLAPGPTDPFDMLRSPQIGTNEAIAGGDLQARYDSLAAAGGGVLVLPPGRVATNLTLHSRHVHLSGAGRGATRLVPRDSSLPVLRALYREGSWDYVTIANLDIGGVDGQGTGFAAGADAYVAGDEFAGRTRFVNVSFADLTVAVRRDAGQIGLILDQCGFGAAEYHLYSVANAPGRGEIMHSGVLSVRDCHFTGARAAVAHIYSPVEGTGAVLFDNCIMERNPGFVFHVPAFANADATTDFVVRDCWNERNATATHATIGKRRVPVRYGLFANAGMIRFDGTPLGPLTLRNAVIDTYRCPLDNLSSLDRDPRSTIRHHEARGFGSYAPIGLVSGLAAAAQSEPPGRALSFVLPHRTTLDPVPGGRLLLSSRMQEPFVLVGSVSVATKSVSGALLPGMPSSQSVALRKGMEVFPAPVAVPAGSWLVWLFAYRLAAGSGSFFQVSGDRGISARRPLDSSVWETLGGMAEVVPGAREISLWMIQDGPSAEIVLGGYNLVAFDTRQAALDFLNSGHFATT